MLEYAINFEDDEGTFLVTCPDLPEVTTFGETMEDAIGYGMDAVNCAIAGRLAHFDEIPVPKAKGEAMVRVSLQLALKVILKWQLERNKFSRQKLAIALGTARPQIDRLFDPACKSRVDQYEQAAAAMGGHIEVSIR